MFPRQGASDRYSPPIALCGASFYFGTLRSQYLFFAFSVRWASAVWRSEEETGFAIRDLRLGGLWAPRQNLSAKNNNKNNEPPQKSSFDADSAASALNQPCEQRQNNNNNKSCRLFRDTWVSLSVRPPSPIFRVCVNLIFLRATQRKNENEKKK